MTNIRKTRLIVIACIMMAVVIFTGCSSHPPLRGERSARNRESDRAELLRLNTKLTQSQIIDRDGEFFSSVAVEQFRVLAPGGLIENKEQAISGLSAWNATKVDLTDTEVVFYGDDVASVMGRMDIEGEMQPVGRWGPLKYMSTWVLEGGEWKLLSRSLTPCLGPLIKMGRC